MRLFWNVEQVECIPDACGNWQLRFTRQIPLMARLSVPVLLAGAVIFVAIAAQALPRRGGVLALILAALCLAFGVAVAAAMITGLREVRVFSEGVTLKYRRDSQIIPWSDISGAEMVSQILRIDKVNGHSQSVALGALPSLPYDMIINAFLARRDFSRAEVEIWVREMREALAE